MNETIKSRTRRYSQPGTCRSLAADLKRSLAKKMAQSPHTFVGSIGRQELLLTLSKSPRLKRRENAEGLVVLAEGWGGIGAAPQDWDLQIKKHFGGRLKWKSETVRQKFIDDKKATGTAYESYIRSKKMKRSEPNQCQSQRATRVAHLARWVKFKMPGPQFN